MRELYRAAGSPSVRAISAAILADSHSADISPETVRRIVAGTRARHTSVLSVVRALAEIAGHDGAAAEEKARQLQAEEEPSGEQESSTPSAMVETSGVDLRGAVIYGLHLTGGDGQTIDLRHAILHDTAVYAGDQQTFHLSDSPLHDTAVYAGDQQTFHLTDSPLHDTAVYAGDHQTFHLTDSPPRDTAVYAQRGREAAAPDWSIDVADTEDDAARPQPPSLDRAPATGDRAESDGRVDAA
ncbi:hypothetical protein [Streptomyces sp. NPDC058861]|uniref:hypothetical protein n=1 Tax=Streptomyces sp. NPDC058861 TaxID=3346653 RepID=UPI0036C2E2F8